LRRRTAGLSVAALVAALPARAVTGRIALFALEVLVMRIFIGRYFYTVKILLDDPRPALYRYLYYVKI
jgi:hypothetical protein